MIDADVAELYGVKTKEINQAVRNNPRKFPYGYLFELDKYEQMELVKSFDHLNKLKYSALPPTVFTERSVYASNNLERRSSCGHDIGDY